jgi:hypothetical protein
MTSTRSELHGPARLCDEERGLPQRLLDLENPVAEQQASAVEGCECSSISRIRV